MTCLSTLAPCAHPTTIDNMLPALWANQIAINVPGLEEAEVDRLADEQDELHRKIFSTPATSFRDLLVKWEIATNGGKDEMLTTMAIEAMGRDLFALSGEAVSPLFDPQAWLSTFKTFGGSLIYLESGYVLGGTTDRQGWCRMVNALRPAERERLSDYIGADA